MVSYKKINVLKRQQENKKKAEEQKKLYKINDDIVAEKVRVVEIDGEKTNEIYSLKEALHLAEESGLDLVEMPSSAEMPVCKIINGSSFLYDQEKKWKKKSNNNTGRQRMIYFSSEINDHDLEVKKKHVELFLAQGHMVKCSLVFHGRTLCFKDLGFEKMKSFINDLKDFGEPKEDPVFDGKKSIVVTLFPKVKK